MKLRPCRLLAISAFVFCFLGSAQTLAQNAYITNDGSGNVSVIDTATNAVTATIAVGTAPFAVAGSPDGGTVYVASIDSDNVSAIATAMNKVTATIPVGNYPQGVAVSPRGSTVYVANSHSNNVSVIDTATNRVTATVPVGSEPGGLAVTPDGGKVYVANFLSNNVSVIASATNKVSATIAVGANPFGVAVTPDGSTVYVANAGFGANTVSAIATTTNGLTATIPVGSEPGGVAVTPDGSKVYVANFLSNNVSVIAAATNRVTATIPVGSEPNMLPGSLALASPTISEPMPASLPSGANKAAPLHAGCGGAVKIASSSRYSQYPAKARRETTTAGCAASIPPEPATTTGVFSTSSCAVLIGIGLTGNTSAARSKPSPETRSTPTTSARLIFPSAVVISAPIASVIR